MSNSFFIEKFGPEKKLRPLEVEVRNGDFEGAVRAFKALVQKEKILSEYKERQYYEKPSVKRRRKQREAVERKLAFELKQKLIESGEWDKRQQKKAKKKEEKNTNG